MESIDKLMLINSFQNTLNDFFKSCYNVYVMQCHINNIKPLSFVDFGNAVDENLKIEHLKKDEREDL